MSPNHTFSRFIPILALLITGIANMQPAYAAQCDNNTAPVARAGSDIRIIRGNTAHFDATSSYDPNGDPLTYRWDFDASNGIGADTSGATTSWAGYETGIYTVTLQVSDGCSTAIDTLTVTVVGEFLLELSVSHTQANPGDTIAYLITYTNKTGRTINSPVISIDFDERYLNATGLNGGSVEGGALVYRPERIVQDQTETRAFQFLISEQIPYGTTALYAAARLTATALSNQESQRVQTIITARPTLVVSVQSDKTTAGRSETVSYTLTYQNHGNTAAERAQLYFDFDEVNADVVAASSGMVNEGGRLRWELGAFYAGQKSSQSVTLRVRSSVTKNEIKNLARITAANAQNFDQIITTAIAGMGSASALQIQATASDENEFIVYALSSHPNELVSMSLKVINSTSQTAENILLSLNYPEQIFKVYERGGATDSGSEATWQIARLTPGESRDFQIVFQVRSTAPQNQPASSNITLRARNMSSVSTQITATVVEGEVKVKGYTTELPRTGGSVMFLIYGLSALVGVGTYFKNGRKLIEN